MQRVVRIMIVTVVVLTLAWVLKEVFGIGDEVKSSEDLVQKIRMSGI
jgi:hypothetical protein